MYCSTQHAANRALDAQVCHPQPWCGLWLLPDAITVIVSAAFVLSYSRLRFSYRFTSFQDFLYHEVSCGCPAPEAPGTCLVLAAFVLVLTCFFLGEIARDLEWQATLELHVTAVRPTCCLNIRSQEYYLKTQEKPIAFTLLIIHFSSLLFFFLNLQLVLYGKVLGPVWWCCEEVVSFGFIILGCVAGVWWYPPGCPEHTGLPGTQHTALPGTEHTGLPEQMLNI